ncbi:MAG: stage V sporulation protein D [Clostridiales bacterium]|uniref:stage V sporulation protein D n=1 Tax=Clostridium sp. N3C TaxID=1776758 RepID=UPI00092DF7D3|nr:stage V sporulation protein D [Clostridium sp. N3C]NLZ47326.1 stage V sporulation protein D [Clostridiales bacterium]SCN21341.1 Sporulation-specific penicillin-binding protein [Clostridium sp. N3C]
MSKKNYRDTVIIKRRMLISLGVLTVLFFSLILRLVYIMVVRSNEYKTLAIEQWTNEVKIDGRRGSIFDRNGNELAVSANVYRVDLAMNTIRSYVRKNNLTFEDIAPKIAQALDIDTEKVLKELYKTLPSGKERGSATLARRIDKEKADKVRDLKINGVLVSPDTQRYYPKNNFLAHVLGTTNSDGSGLAGIELQYNDVLKGIPGLRITETDRRSDELPYTISDFTKPVDGKNLILTIDSTIQGFAEKAAEQALNDNKARAVSIMVMDPKTGEILAMANKPDFNPNKPREGATTADEMAKLWRNRMVSDTYEPGSIFKVFTAIAAMEKGLVSESDTFNCTGSKTVANRTIHCWKRTGHGEQNFVQILENSCNVGFMELGERLQAATLNEYIKKFGFGKKTGIDLPGEATGIVKKTEDITTVDLATISFGQSNTVTPIQYMAAFNAIANGGVMVTPHIMKAITHVDENNQMVVDETFETYSKKYEKKQIVSKEQADLLCTYLEKVVSEGGGKNAYVEGYRIGGKTGTAQKVDPNTGTYGVGKYVASFAGMAPVDDPKVTVFISIDEPDPSKYYAGQIAAPVAKQVFYDIFNYLSIKGDVSIEDTLRSMKKDVILPDLRGMKKSEAIKTLKEVNLEYEIEEQGDIIVDMTPKPGYTVKEGDKIILYTGSGENYNKDVVVPDLTGYTQEEAEKLLKNLGLEGQFIGEGLVAAQSISPGKTVQQGTSLIFELDVVGGY